MHLGAGRDSFNFTEKVQNVKFVSFDIDEIGLRRNRNKFRVVGDANNLPFKNEVFELIMTENVFEHIEKPKDVLSECNRCLKRGRYLAFLCPNRYSYISLVSLITPHWLRTKLLKIIGGTPENDVFPVYYRLNSTNVIKKLSSETDFNVEMIQSFVGWPSYWEFSDLMHRVFVVIHKILERFSWLNIFHITLVGILVKKT